MAHKLVWIRANVIIACSVSLKCFFLHVFEFTVSGQVSDFIVFWSVTRTPTFSSISIHWWRYHRLGRHREVSFPSHEWHRRFVGTWWRLLLSTVAYVLASWYAAGITIYCTSKCLVEQCDSIFFIPGHKLSILQRFLWFCFHGVP